MQSNLNLLVKTACMNRDGFTFKDLQNFMTRRYKFHLHARCTKGNVVTKTDVWVGVRWYQLDLIF